MQLSAKILNKNLVWSALLKPRVGTVVTGPDGNTYVNTSGMNSVVTNTVNWQLLPTKVAASPTAVTFNAGNVEGTDPNFYIDMTSSGLPAFPLSVTVYISTTGNTADYTPVNPVSYNPITKQLGGIDSPVSFPDMLVMVVFM